MKRMLFMVVLLSAIGQVHAELCQVTPGSISCGKVTKSKIIADGMATLNGTKVTGKTYVNGLMNSANCELNTLEINGETTINNCKVKGNVEVNGLLDARGSEFLKNIAIASNEATFDNSKVEGDVLVDHDSETKLYLLNKSIITGNVQFTNGKGKVYKSKDSVVKGKVIGGDVLDIENKN